MKTKNLFLVTGYIEIVLWDQFEEKLPKCLLEDLASDFFYNPNYFHGIKLEDFEIASLEDYDLYISEREVYLNSKVKFFIELPMELDDFKNLLSHVPLFNADYKMSYSLVDYEVIQQS